MNPSPVPSSSMNPRGNNPGSPTPNPYVTGNNPGLLAPVMPPGNQGNATQMRGNKPLTNFGLSLVANNNAQLAAAQNMPTSPVPGQAAAPVAFYGIQPQAPMMAAPQQP